MTGKKKICFLSDIHVVSDSRLLKEISSLKRYARNLEICILGVEDFKGEFPFKGIKVFTFKGGKRLFNIGFWKRLIEIYKQEKPILYHFHDPDLIPVGLLLKLLGKKVIYDVHENNKYLVLNRGPNNLLIKFIAFIWDWFERTASLFFDGIIAVDEHIRAKFPSPKTVKVTNMPPKNLFLNLERKEHETFNIIHSGRISPERGLNVVVKAVEKSQKYKDIKWFIIGGVEPDNSSLKNFENVKIINRIPFDELIKMYSLFDLGFILLQPIPSHIFEFNGERNTKLFEYMGAGLPVIAPNFEPLVKFLSPIGCCLFVDPTDPDEFWDAILYLYKNPDVRKEMGMKGRKAVLERYNWEEQEKRLISLYKKVLKLR